MDCMMFCSRHCENVSPYLAKQQQWLRNRCSSQENACKIAYFTHSMCTECTQRTVHPQYTHFTLQKTVPGQVSKGEGGGSAAHTECLGGLGCSPSSSLLHHALEGDIALGGDWQGMWRQTLDSRSALGMTVIV